MTDFLAHLERHIVLSAGALAIAAVLAIPLGAAIARATLARAVALGAAGILRVIPSLAILTLALPYLGLGVRPALVALAVLAIPPIVINTDVAFRTIPSATLDAARGLGMSGREMRRRVEWPLAAPVIFAGVRTAAIEVIASATLAAFIGGGGFGEYVVNGLANNDMTELVEGGGAVAALALLAEASLGMLGRRFAAAQR